MVAMIRIIANSVVVNIGMYQWFWPHMLYNTFILRLRSTKNQRKRSGSTGYSLLVIKGRERRRVGGWECHRIWQWWQSPADGDIKIVTVPLFWDYFCGSSGIIYLHQPIYIKTFSEISMLTVWQPRKWDVNAFLALYLQLFVNINYWHPRYQGRIHPFWVDFGAAKSARQ